MASQNSDILLPFFLWRENYSQNTTKSEVDTVNTVVVQSQSHVWLFMTSLTIAHQLTLSTLSWGLFRFMSIETLMLRNHLNPCCPIMLLASVFLRTRVFSNELALHIRSSKYWSFSFSISPSNEYSGLISFRIDWFGLLAVQETLKSLLQHHNLTEIFDLV